MLSHVTTSTPSHASSFKDLFVSLSNKVLISRRMDTKKAPRGVEGLLVVSYTSYLHSNSTQPSSYAHRVFKPCVLCHGCERLLLQVKSDHVPLYFPNLYEEERRVMKSFLHGRSTIRPNGLEVVKATLNCKGEIKGQTYILSPIEEKLVEVYNQIDFLEKKNTSQGLYAEYGEFVSLKKTIGDKLFISMSNMYLFNLYKGMHMNFNESFPDGQVLDFKNVFSIRALAAKDYVYLTQET
ncbi:hypothetical protein POTOM_047382 [Populus tomentosa]|uniref:Uncharacterized protein n=1 Tax=Populus tomentosa TaxID=118781 RepID=A0A8X7YBX1_POPTO|nr:hypothetical protein POTOM_047382 [Populus tomentosa]